MKMGLPPKEAPEPLALPTGSVSCGCKSWKLW
jgi:hypothetical protein